MFTKDTTKPHVSLRICFSRQRQEHVRSFKFYFQQNFCRLYFAAFSLRFSEIYLTIRSSVQSLKDPSSCTNWLFIVNVETLGSSRIRIDTLRNSSMRVSKLQVLASVPIKLRCTRRRWQRLTRIPFHCHF